MSGTEPNLLYAEPSSILLRTLDVQAVWVTIWRNALHEVLISECTIILLHAPYDSNTSRRIAEKAIQMKNSSLTYSTLHQQVQYLLQFTFHANGCTICPKLRCSILSYLYELLPNPSAYFYFSFLNFFVFSASPPFFVLSYKIKDAMVNKNEIAFSIIARVLRCCTSDKRKNMYIHSVDIRAHTKR